MWKKSYSVRFTKKPNYSIYVRRAPGETAPQRGQNKVAAFLRRRVGNFCNDQACNRSRSLCLSVPRGPNERPLETTRTSQKYGIEGFEGDPELAPHYFERPDLLRRSTRKVCVWFCSASYISLAHANPRYRGRSRGTLGALAEIPSHEYCWIYFRVSSSYSYYILHTN